MMRGVLGLLVILAIGVVAGAAPVSAASSDVTKLTVVYWDEGRGEGRRVVWTLRCNPPAGTLPGRVAACRALAPATSRQLFRPTPKDMACTEIFGGPQVAFVSGVLHGRPLWARFSRADGCQIERWERVGFLLPPGGA